MPAPDATSPVTAQDCPEDIYFNPGQAPVVVETGRSFRFQAVPWRLQQMSIGNVTVTAEQPMLYGTGPRAPVEKK